MVQYLALMNERSELAATATAVRGIFYFLRQTHFTYTCIGSNTAHLMLQPSPEAVGWCVGVYRQQFEFFLH